MKAIDLTHTISENMPVFPGTEPPVFKAANTYAENGFKETLLSMYSHTGTHADPPAHIFEGRTTLDRFPIDRFVGKAVAVDCRRLKEGENITMKEIESCGEYVRTVDFLLFNLGWNKRWGASEYYKEYPCIDRNVLNFILETGKKGLGFDVISVDPIADSMLTRHKMLFAEHEIIIIENLKNLELCGNMPFWFMALPLKWKDSDGAPVRAIAFWPD